MVIDSLPHLNRGVAVRKGGDGRGSPESTEQNRPAGVEEEAGRQEQDHEIIERMPDTLGETPQFETTRAQAREIAAYEPEGKQQREYIAELAALDRVVSDRRERDVERRGYQSEAYEEEQERPYPVAP